MKYILLIVGLILLFFLVYFYFKYIQIYENNLLPLQQVKLLLNETRNIFDERIFILSEKRMEWWSYKYNSEWST